TWEYNVAANTWLTKTSIPLALAGPATAVINGHLYVAGGRSASNSNLSTLYDYDIAANTWATRTAMLSGVNLPGAGVVNNKLYVFGGGTPFVDNFGLQVDKSKI